MPLPPHSSSLATDLPPLLAQPGTRDDFTVVPDSQLIVARTVRRDNTTRYTVNGRTATPGEVKQLLLGKGIDLTHNRFLILQVRPILISFATSPCTHRRAHSAG